MAATVVSVVIFLCGVLVGRGVRAERGSGTETAAVNDSPADITPTQPPPPLVPPAAGSDPTAAVAPPPAEDFTYPKRLEQPNQKQPQEDLKPAAKASAPAPAPAKPAITLKSSSPPASSSSAPLSAANDRAQAPAAAAPGAPGGTDSQPSGQAYVVQVTALNVRSEADAIAKHLTSKGYAAYVSANGAPAVYRVRVGSFKTRREAETVAAKLQKEEQMKPWVTR